MNRKKYRYLILAAVIIFFVGLAVIFWQPILSFVSDPESLRTYIQENGFLGVLVFCLLNIVQVIFAVIPGGPFELAAGYVFGVLPGTIICDISMTIASVLVFLLVRKFGMQFVELFIDPEEISKIHFLDNNQRVQSVLFIVFLIPAAPKDVITYLVGLTKISVWSWIFICFVGRFPAILLTALSGSALGDQRYGIVAVVIVVFLVCYLVGMKIYQKFNAPKEQ